MNLLFSYIINNAVSNAKLFNSSDIVNYACAETQLNTV